MITATITKIKNGAVTLPKFAQKFWRGADVYVRVSGDTAILKKVYNENTIFDSETKKKLRLVGRDISDQDVNEAVIWARSGGRKK